MSTPDAKRIIDGFAYIKRGVHSGVSPNQLDRDQLSMAVNAQLRTGMPKQRPAIIKHELTFADAFAQNAFESGFFQGGFTYRWDTSSLLVASVSGHFYTVDPFTFAVTDWTSGAGPAPSQPWSPHAWFEQAEMFVVRQDGGFSIPLIFDGASLKESNPSAGQVPGGKMMKYALGRLWITSPSGRDFVGGDLVFGPSGTAGYGYRDSVLWFTENTFLNEGGAFTVSDQITAMRQQATIDTTLGQGPLVVFFEGGAALVNAPFDRTIWKDVEFPIQTVGLLSNGALAQASTLSINNDIWFRSVDGIRSFKAARREDSSWGSTPMSYEMDRVIRYDQTGLLDYGSAVLFDNRLLMTCSPVIVPLRGVVSRGLIALDFQQVSSIAADQPSTMAGSESPAYDGLWNGLRILHICTLKVKGTERCFIWALDCQSKIALYELTTDELFDDDGTQRIDWSIETPSYRFTFDGVGKNLMRLMGANLHRSALNGVVNFCVSYRADRYPVWNSFSQWCWSDCAEQSCVPTIPGCSLLANQTQYRPPKLLSNPPDECEVASQKLQRLGYEFQAKIDVSGPAQLDLFRLWSYDFPEARYEQCVASADCRDFRACGGFLFNYSLCGPIAPVFPLVSGGTPPNLPQTPTVTPVNPTSPGCAAPPSIDYFGASTLSIYPGDPVTLAWGPVFNADQLTLDQGIGAVISPSSVVINPLVTTIYTLTASCDGTTVSRSVLITVTALPPGPTPPPPPPPPPPPAIDFNNSTPPVLACGGSALDWDWIDGGKIVRYPSSDSSTDPNSVFDAGLLAWWAEQVELAFLASGTTYSSYKLYWFWSAAGDSWNASTLFEFGSPVTYAGNGWTVIVTYCP